MQHQITDPSGNFARPPISYQPLRNPRPFPLTTQRPVALQRALPDHPCSNVTRHSLPGPIEVEALRLVRISIAGSNISPICVLLRVVEGIRVFLRPRKVPLCRPGHALERDVVLRPGMHTPSGVSIICGNDVIDDPSLVSPSIHVIVGVGVAEVICSVSILDRTSWRYA